jgi:hypothetical protein
MQTSKSELCFHWSPINLAATPYQRFSDGNAFWVTSVGDNLGLVGKGVDHAEKDWIDA